jgi:predicted RNA-binding protein (virulence factor B family)
MLNIEIKITDRLSILIYVDASNKRRATLVLDGDTDKPTDLWEFEINN